jgi:DNA polymerase-3 subunit alpha
MKFGNPKPKCKVLLFSVLDWQDNKESKSRTILNLKVLTQFSTCAAQPRQICNFKNTYFSSMFLIFDTETTGLPRNYNAPISDFDNWPRMVQIAWQLHDITGKLLQSNTLIVKPEGYTIPFNAVQVHGISTERALKEGESLLSTLEQFTLAIHDAQYLCGHNVEFDLNIIGAEFLRCGLKTPFEGKTQIDTKNDATTNFCALPGGRGGKFKWPTLSELYFKLFSNTFEEAHNAAFDVQATARVLFELLKRRIITVNELSANEAKAIHFEDIDLSDLLLKEKALKEEKAIQEQHPPLAPVKPAEISSELKFPFSHLHNHSQYSVLQSVTEVAELVKKAAEQNMEAVALTDHGNMYATFLFWQ